MSFYTLGFISSLIDEGEARAVFVGNEIKVDIDLLSLDLSSDLYELTPQLEDHKLEVIVCK